MDGYQLPILYSSLSQYARDHGISGDDLNRFHIFINAVDAEWLAFRKEAADAEDAKRKDEEARR
jgi:hypothetical protein